MAYKIIDIEGIGPAYAEKLEAAGVKTTDDLLDKADNKKGREKLAEETGISEKLSQMIRLLNSLITPIF